MNITTKQQLSSFEGEEEVKLDVQELNINLANQILYHYKIFNQLSQKIPNLIQLCLCLNKVPLQNSFLVNLEQQIKSLKYLKNIELKLLYNGFKQLQVQTFLTFIRARFFPGQLVEYSYEENQVFLSCSSCMFSFEKMEKYIPLFQDTKLQLVAHIKQNESEYTELIYTKVPLYYNANLSLNLKDEPAILKCISLHCQSSSNIFLEYKEEQELYNYNFDYQKFVAFTMSVKQYYSPLFQKSTMKKIIKRRFNFQWRSQTHIFIMSFQDERFPFEKQRQVREILFNFDFENKLSLFMKTKFEFDFYKSFFIPTVFLKRNTPYDISFKEFSTKLIICKLSCNRASENNSQLDVEIMTQTLEDVLQVLQDFFNCSENLRCQHVKLSCYESPIKDLQNFHVKLGSVSKKDLVKELTLKLSNNKSENLSYPIINSPHGLLKINLSIMNPQQLVEFIIQNKGYLTNDYKTYDSTFTLAVRVSKLAKFSIENDFYKEDSCIENLLLDRISLIIFSYKPQPYQIVKFMKIMPTLVNIVYLNTKSINDNQK